MYLSSPQTAPTHLHCRRVLLCVRRGHLTPPCQPIHCSGVAKRSTSTQDSALAWASNPRHRLRRDASDGLIGRLGDVVVPTACRCCDLLRHTRRHKFVFRIEHYLSVS